MQTFDGEHVEDEIVTPPAVEEHAPEAQTAEEQQAFTSGFDEAIGIEEPETPPEPRIAGYTEEELRTKLELVAEVAEKFKQRDEKIFGTIGGLKQQFEELRSRAPSQPGVNITRDSLKRLGAEFPELADMLAEDLSQVSVSGPVTNTGADEFKTALAEASKAYETKLLTVMHKDWRSVVASPEFSEWKNTLPEDERNELESSWDALFIGEKVAAFKATRVADEEAKRKKAQRLEAAITPRGTTGATSQSDNDAFVAGFKSARRG